MNTRGTTEQRMTNDQKRHKRTKKDEQKRHNGAKKEG